MIEIRNLCKRFGSFTAVDQVSFRVERGEVLGFLGPNGAGKSTTMKMLTGFLDASEGTATVCGHDVGTEAMAVKEKIGYLPEGAPLYPDMTPLGFLKFVAKVRGLSGAKASSRIDEVVKRVQLEGVLHQRIETLSKGFKRRVGLAQAILHDPEVLILDEPTDGLDPNQKAEVRSLIAEMAKDKVIVLSTHILEEVEAVCTRAIIIAKGKVLFDGTPRELSMASPSYGAVELSIEGTDAEVVRSKLSGLPGVREIRTPDNAAAWGASPDATNVLVLPEPGVKVLPAVAKCAHEAGWTVDHMSVETSRLDGIFREITLDGRTVQTNPAPTTPPVVAEEALSR